MRDHASNVDARFSRSANGKSTADKTVSGRIAKATSRSICAATGFSRGLRLDHSTLTTCTSCQSMGKCGCGQL